jgi:hypothetical protein
VIEHDPVVVVDDLSLAVAAIRRTALASSPESVG